MYFPLSSKMHGATELLLKQSARALSELGHRVDVICCEQREQYVDGVYWWTPVSFPRTADVLVAYDQLTGVKDFIAYKHLVMPLTFSRPPTAGLEGRVDRVLCLSELNKQLVLRNCPGLKPESRQVGIFPPCVDTSEYFPIPKVPGRIVWCNSPDRGLYHFIKLWPMVKERVPNASMVITYDLEGRLEQAKWMHDGIAYRLWKVWEWAKSAPDVHISGVLSREEVVREQLKADVFAYPCDPPEKDSMVHCIAALECAAAGCTLIMPEIEAFPELFGDVAVMTSAPVNYEEWAEAIATAIQRPTMFEYKVNAGMELAERHSYQNYKERWRKLLEEIV